MNNEILHKFLPGVLLRHELPDWFIIMADQRSKGNLEYIVWDPENTNVIHADYFVSGEFYESKTFKMKYKL